MFVHEQVSAGRREAIAKYGAEVREVEGNYDDAVRHAAATAAVRRLDHRLQPPTPAAATFRWT